MLRKTISLIFVGLISLIGTSSCTHGLAIGAHHHYILAEAESDYRAHHYAEAFRKTYYLTKTGDPRAEYALGNMYFYGHGTVMDQDLARYWIRKAAYKHYPPAEHALYLLERVNVPQYMPANNFHEGYPRWKAFKHKQYCVFANDRLRQRRTIVPRHRPIHVASKRMENKPRYVKRTIPKFKRIRPTAALVKAKSKLPRPTFTHVKPIKPHIKLPEPMFTQVKPRFKLPEPALKHVRRRKAKRHANRAAKINIRRHGSLKQSSKKG